MGGGMTRRAFVTLGVGAMLMPLVGCSDTSRDDFVETAFGAMPNVVGLSAQDAWTTLVEAEFLPMFVQATAEGDPGTVASLDVRELDAEVFSIMDANGEIHDEYDGTDWKATALVGLSGMAQIPGQILYGLSEAEAVAQLEDAGISNVDVTHEGEVDPDANLASEVEPLPGAWVLATDEVRLTVTSDVVMPNVIGDDPLTATQRLTTLGLVPSPAVTEYEVVSGGTPTVVSASADQGEELRVGSVVELEYSEPLER